jgi:hypothetical protein
MRSTIAILALLAASPLLCAAQIVGRTTNGNTVQLFTLTPTGGQGAAIGSVTLPAGETTEVDAFRCMPYGTFCLFTTSSTNGNAYLYNVTASNAALISKTTIPNAAVRNLHVDHSNGEAYTIAYSSKSTVVVGVLNGQVTPLVDITSYIPSTGYITTGGSTQCSDNDAMWVAVHSGSSAPDTMLTLSLPQRTVVNVTALRQPALTTWWAECIAAGDNFPSGAYISGRTLSYGHILGDGSYAEFGTATLPTTPPNLQLSGVLSQDDQDHVFMTLYAPGVQNGYLAVGNFNPNSTFNFLPIDYLLSGAAALS